MNRLIAKLPSNTENQPDVNQPEWYTTKNFNVRKPNFVILHHTAENSVEKTVNTFNAPHVEASSHYIVGRDGTIYHLVNDYLRTWHAGSGRWGPVTDMNSCSIGIEMDNNGKEPFPGVQTDALIKLLSRLKEDYKIPQANFIGHLDVAPNRKQDPSELFPWKKLADAGFGYWYNVNTLVEPPADFNPLLALRVIGYDITTNRGAAIEAFKRHYVQSNISQSLTDYDKRILYNVYLKYQ